MGFTDESVGSSSGCSLAGSWDSRDGRDDKDKPLRLD